MTVTIMAFDRAPRVTRCAFDRKSVRRYDQDGRLHVEVSNMAKEAVDQYLGEEIPGWQELGLDAKKIYRLYRPAEELEKAVATFNNLPILREHIPVSAEAPQQDFVIGSTGTDAVFADGFIRNSAVIWVQDDIDDIESEAKREWSPGYYYTPDMTAGKFNGLQYDGVMRDIVGNHVALVDEGRQGRDVVVGDRQPEALNMVLKSKRALMLHGALVAFVGPKLAQDSKVNLTAALGKVTAKTRGKDAAGIAAAVVKAASPKLAQDEGLAVEDVVKIINAVDGVEGAPAEDEDNIPEPGPDPDDGMVNDADNDLIAKIMQFLTGKLSDEDMGELGELVGGNTATDEEPDDGEDGCAPEPASKVAKPAMDKRTVGKVLAEIREAERLVAPHIGEVSVAMDSAAAIYKLALDNAGVDTAGVPASAYKAMVKLLPAPNSGDKPVLAMDRQNAGKSFAERFPTANTLIPS